MVELPYIMALTDLDMNFNSPIRISPTYFEVQGVNLQESDLFRCLGV